MTKCSTSLWRVSLMVSFRSVFFSSSNGQESSAGLAMKTQMLECIIVQSEKTCTLACVVAAAVRSAACRQQCRGAHLCMCPALPDGKRRGQKSHTRGHCHLRHAGTSGICEASAGLARHPAAFARAARRCRISGWIQSGSKYVSIYLSLSLSFI